MLAVALVEGKICYEISCFASGTASMQDRHPTTDGRTNRDKADAIPHDTRIFHLRKQEQIDGESDKNSTADENLQNEANNAEESQRDGDGS